MQSDNFKHNIYLPARLTEQLSKIPYFPVTVVEAPSGFGKTTAVKEYLNNALPDGARQYWYTCLSENSLMAWSGICDMFSKINKELGSNLEKLGFPTLVSLIYITTAFKDINCDNESYIVIDNYQIIKSDILQELISVFSMHGCPRLHLIFITQSLGKKAQFIFHNNNIHKIDSSYFFFDKESTAVLLKMEGIRLSDNELNSVYASTEGWISALRLQISSYKQSGSFDYIADIDHLVEHAIWNRLTDEERTCLVSLSVMDTNGQGVGADSVLHAEMMLMRGDDSHAEILCHRALYQARSKQEICICLCAEQILARIAILRGDVEGFITAIENIKSYAKEGSNLYILRMVDICLSVISVSLDTTDMVAKWFCDMESIKKKVYARAIPYVSILYSHLLVREKRYAEFLGLADEMISMSEEMNYVFPRLYSLIFKARAYYFRGSEGKALKNLEEAFALAFPDKIYLPFAQFSYMDDMLAKIRTGIGQQLKALPDSKDMKEQISSPEASAAPAKWKKDIDNVMELYKRYHKGREIILNAMQQKKSPLTPREREVALLAQNRLSHQEIAEKLCISKATVRTILHNAYNKLGIHSRTELYKIDL